MSARTRGARLFWFFFALYALTSSGNAFRVPDEFEVYFQAEHLVDAGDISVPQTLAVHEFGVPIFFGKFGLDGRPYAPYGPGVAYLLVPFHLAGRLVARLAHIPRAPLPAGIAWEFVVGGVTALGTAFAAALAVAGFYRAGLTLGAPPEWSLRLAAILGGATILWPYGTTLYSEAWLAAAFSWAAALMLEARDGGSGTHARVIGAAALLATAGLTKPTALVVASAFVVAVLIDRHHDARARATAALALTAGIALAAMVNVGWNVWRFGSPLDFGYNLAGMIRYPPARSFAVEDVPRGLFVELLTPGKSLFVWAPATLPALLALPQVWRRERGLAGGLAIALASTLVFYAAFIYPDGGYAHGPRHLVPLVPLLMLPLAMPAIRVSRAALATCAAFGFLLAALAVTVSFMEDQSPVPGSTGSVSPYYESIDPIEGRPSTRYRIDYIPFKFALTSGHWLSSRRLAGNGPDFFALHLGQARQSMPGGRSIPPWLPWGVTVPWIAVLVWSASGLTRAGRESPR